MDVVELVPSVCPVPGQLVWMNVWQCGIRSVICCCVWKKVIVASTSLINREMTKTGQAAGLSGSHPLGYIITDLENRFVPFVCFGMKRLLPVQPYVMIYLVHSSWVSGRFCVGRVARCSCWTPVYLSLEVHWSGGSSLPCHCMESIFHCMPLRFWLWDRKSVV